MLGQLNWDKVGLQGACQMIQAMNIPIIVGFSVIAGVFLFKWGPDRKGQKLQT